MKVLVILLLLVTPVSAGEYYVLDSDVVTEWTTVSRTIPVNNCSTCLVMQYEMCNQVGTKYKVVYALIEWGKEIKKFELERVKVEDGEKLERSVSCGTYDFIYRNN